jgi:hypothetical protein
MEEGVMGYKEIGKNLSFAASGLESLQLGEIQRFSSLWSIIAASTPVEQNYGRSLI